MEIPGLGVESGLQLLAYTTAIARSTLLLQPTVCGSAGSFNPLSKARDRTCILTDTVLGS